MDKQTKNNQELFFHLGLPKSASTFLQVIVFPKLEGIQYFRKRLFKNFVSLAKDSSEQKILFSTESDRSFDKKLNKVIEHFPEARIILVFRRQDKWITSKYKYYIRKHGHLPFKKFFNLEKDNGLWKKEELYFSKFVSLVQDKSPRPPLILTVEELKRDYQQFLKKIISFLEIPEPSKPIQNKILKGAFSDKQIILLRKFNTFYRYKELKSSSKFFNKVHYKYREFLLHIVAFSAGFVPPRFLKTEALIPAEALEKIKAYYKEDWKYILTLSQKKEPLIQPSLTLRSLYSNQSK